MCGVAGYWNYPGINNVDRHSLLQKMSQALSHRGPDSGGAWVDQGGGPSIAHRRLAVIDISKAGAQPMMSRSGRYILSYNGEMYNTKAMRCSLEGVLRVDWSGHSDTEVMLELIDRFGVETAVEELQGMFAFALWDRQESELWLGRDRFGEKPMYYGWCNSALIFSSELKPFRRHPDFEAKIDAAALERYFQLGYVPAPLSIYEDVYKLQAGHLVRFQAPTKGAQRVRSYWSAIDAAKEARTNVPVCSYGDALTVLDKTLADIVSSRMVSDVPLGVMLSGGVDSSLIAALAQSKSAVPVKTFTIGNRQAGYDEALHARKVADHLGTEHTELYVSPTDAQDILPDLATIYDEPFADSSQIPSILVSRLVRGDVKVALTGDGGDELFGGYNRHIYGRRLDGVVSHVPFAVRRQFACLIRCVGTDRLNRWLAAMSPILPRQLSGGTAGDKLHKLAMILLSSDNYSLGENIQSIWYESDNLIDSPVNRAVLHTPRYGDFDFTSQLMLGDTLRYLPDDILVKMDRASMSVGLETRAPFLDHNLYNFAWSLPEKYKISKGQGKRILRDLLYRYVPANLVDRPKQGFAIPVGSWLRVELKEWAEELLSPTALLEHDFLNVPHVRKCWIDHLSGKQNNDAKLWSILMFQMWYRAQAG